ncbi:MAG: hypothetical protein K2L14_01065 [Duncaniella sp.]|nr:hypothetical protein [Duncaniella sp.]
MKLFKYLSIFAACTVALTSCSDDKEDYSINTVPGVGVSVETAEMVVNEMKGIFQIPLVVTGEPNGYVKVTVKVMGTDDPEQEQAIADSHFYVTSETINIPADTKTASVEIRTQYLESRDPDRYFRVVIESAEGAIVQPLNTCTVAIQDRLSSPIYALSGPWQLEFSDYDNTPIVTPNATLDVVNEATGECQFIGFYPALYSGLVLNVVLREDEATGKYNMSIPLGTTAAEGLNFTGLGECDVIVTDSSGKTSGEIIGTWNDDYTMVQFSESICLAVFNEGASKGLWDRLSNMKFMPLL